CFGSCHGISSPLEWRPVADETRASELINWVRATNPKLADIDEQVPSAIRANGPHIFTQPPCAMFSGSTQVRKSCD
ncbi:MAG TPA: hypothetical protein VN496_16455, partial [Burkholderiales bacterium]|nr:hypothetical protein [Burkholderiales bacterium]